MRGVADGNGNGVTDDDDADDDVVVEEVIDCN